MSTSEQPLRSHVPEGHIPAPPPAAFGDPAGLGLAAFALTTFVLSSFNAGWFPEAASSVVLGLALFYGGAVQILAGLWEFANRNTFGAVAFCSYGGFWMSFWYLLTATKLPADSAGSAIGIYLLAWGIFTLYMAIAASRTNLVVLLVFIALTLTYFALAAGEFAGSSTWTIIGGWLGIITAIFAWYGSFATVTNFTYKRTLLPLWPLAPAAR
ncbi:acetate uptake transporter [Microbacterium elymi]|uniref:Acetate uptake transporter n=1 Tax=Microbacterium elymi TaxID=2909587 RepID=A0ABY5NGY4_9MICO|nr:acetate uptake transporter [Microbacterium elymi]UUT34422.1 acetate uptake transporter [Microbacterium elymi]